MPSPNQYKYLHLQNQTSDLHGILSVISKDVPLCKFIRFIRDLMGFQTCSRTFGTDLVDILISNSNIYIYFNTAIDLSRNCHRRAVLNNIDFCSEMPH